jgi:transcriptional regulator with XRE-family HTH domain
MKLTMKQSFFAKKSDECIQLKVRMLQRRLTYQDVADMAKLNARVVSNVMCGNNTDWPPRAAINRALREKIFKAPSARRRSPRPQSAAAAD